LISEGKMAVERKKNIRRGVETWNQKGGKGG